jgi:hypothetical protein
MTGKELNHQAREFVHQTGRFHLHTPPISLSSADPLRCILNDNIARADGAMMNPRITVRTGIPAHQLGLVTIFTGATLVVTICRLEQEIIIRSLVDILPRYFWMPLKHLR